MTDEMREAVRGTITHEELEIRDRVVAAILVRMVADNDVLFQVAGLGRTGLELYDGYVDLTPEEAEVLHQAVQDFRANG